MPKIYGAFLLSLLLIGGGIYFLRQARSFKPTTPNIFVESEPLCDESYHKLIGCSSLPDDDLTHLATLHERKNNYQVISDGQTMHSILAEKGIAAAEIHALTLALKPYLRPKDLAAGDLYQLLTEDFDKQPRVSMFVIKKLDSNRLPISYTVTRDKGKDSPQFKVQLLEAPLTEERELIRVDVSGTLYKSFMSLPFGNELMQRLMTVFAWRMRMPDEVFSKDHIEILVNKKYAENNFIGYGTIQSVSYQQSHRTLFATHFRSKDGKIDGIFDSEGKSLEKEFSLSPVHETVATSEQNWRMHPVRKIRIRHNGIDFRGTIGTPFFAIADGEVIEKRFDKMVGFMIRIRHKYGLYSEYFHADSLMDNLSVGSRVKRGQKIGAIGNTGVLCTGPHLHLGTYQMNGDKRKYVNILNFRKKLLDMPALAGQYLIEFNDHVKKSLALMERIKNAPPQIKRAQDELVKR